MPPAIEAEGLVKRFGATTALAGASLTAAEGTVLGVLGPNGAGKTTAVRVLATLLAPDGGRALVGGFDVATEPHRVRSLIGLTGQYAGVDEALTGFENLLLNGTVVATGTPDDLKARAGAAVLQMRPARAGQLEIVTRVAGELAGQAPTVEQGTVAVPAADEALMPAVVRRLDDVGVHLAELTLRRATLDEVFLALTGHRAVDVATDATTAATTDARETA